MKVQLRTEDVIREGGDATGPNLLLECVAGVIGLGLLAVNTVVSVALLFWPPKAKKS